MMTQPATALIRRVWPALVALCLLSVAAVPAGAVVPRAPGNGLIAYDSDRTGDYLIYTMNPDGSNQTQLTTDWSEFPSFSPDGTKIAYDDDYDIWVMDANGVNQTNLTNGTGRNRMASWSPDGSKIAFVSDRSGGSHTWHVWVMGSDGSSPVDLTPKCNATCTQPAFSPDGTKIAYTANLNSATSYDLWIMNADGTGKKKVFTGNSSWPAWSPSGTRIAIVWRIGRSDQLWTIKPSGRGARFLVKTNWRWSRAAWSPDGTKIATSRRVSGNVNIWTMNIDGSNLKNLTGPGKVDDTPSWQAI